MSVRGRTHAWSSEQRTHVAIAAGEMLSSLHVITWMLPRSRFRLPFRNCHQATLMSKCFHEQETPVSIKMRKGRAHSTKAGSQGSTVPALFTRTSTRPILSPRSFAAACTHMKSGQRSASWSVEVKALLGGRCQALKISLTSSPSQKLGPTSQAAL